MVSSRTAGLPCSAPRAISSFSSVGLRRAIASASSTARNSGAPLPALLIAATTSATTPWPTGPITKKAATRFFLTASATSCALKSTRRSPGSGTS
jgi:hypothetical protein